MILKESIKEYIQDFDTTNCFGVSLTLKQRVDYKSINNDISSQNLKHFLNVLNKKCFGNSFKRFNIKLRVLPVLEKSSNGRLHYHLTLQNPFPDNPYKFESMINHTWFDTNYGFRHVHIHRNINEGWNDYITKFNTSDDEVDWISKFSDRINKMGDFSPEEKHEFLKGVIDNIQVSTLDTRTHEVIIKFKIPYVEDSIKWNDKSNKSKGYTVKDGGFEIGVEIDTSKKFIPKQRGK